MNRLYLDCNGELMSGAEYLPNGPLVKGNPFTLLPIEHEHKVLLVGREDIVTPITSQMINGNPGVHLIVGETGSGRSSILQCLSPSDSRHIGTVWGSSDPTSRFLTEALVGLTKAFSVPPTPQTAADKLRDYLNANQGPLPLIAFDYNVPNSLELRTVIEEILPIMRRMRAMVVFAVSNDQIVGWESSLLDKFDQIHWLEPLNSKQVRDLIDCRMGSVSNETIVTEESDLMKLHSFSNGNPAIIIRQLSRHLSYLISPDKSKTAEFITYEPTSFTQSSVFETPKTPSYSATPQQSPPPIPTRPLFTPSNSPPEDEYDAWFSGTTLPNETRIEPPKSTNFEPVVDSLILDDNDSMESEVGWEDEVIHFASRGGIDDFEGDPLYLESEEDEPVPLDPFAEWDKGSEKTLHDEYISEDQSSADLEESIDIIDDVPDIQYTSPQTEDSVRSPHFQTNTIEIQPPPPRGGIMGLAERSKQTKARLDAKMPPNPPTSQIMGIDPLPVPEPVNIRETVEPNLPYVESFVDSELENNPRNKMDRDPMTARPPDLTSEGASLWVEDGIQTSDSPHPPQINPVRAPISPSVPLVSPEEVVRGLNVLRSPRWDPDEPLRPERLRDVSDADVIVLTASATRDISPSDLTLQARLQVGRSRLSQIFNDLRRHGFLSVRKEGRTRWYRMTAAASRLLTEVEE